VCERFCPISLEKSLVFLHNTVHFPCCLLAMGMFILILLYCGNAKSCLLTDLAPSSIEINSPPCERSFSESEPGFTCQSADGLNAPRQVCGKSAEFPQAIKKMGSLKINVLLKPKKDSEPVLLNLDVSKRPDAITFLQALRESGWAVIKELTAVTSKSRQEDIVSNRVSLLLLSQSSV
jgi:hypothetical protein